MNNFFSKINIDVCFSLIALLFFQIIMSQSEGIVYNTFIENEKPKEINIPGINVSEKKAFLRIDFRVSIIDEAGVSLYSEIHNTTTDLLGNVSFVIGRGNPVTADNLFSNISWNYKPKKIKVEKKSIGIDTDFKLYEEKELFYSPTPAIFPKVRPWLNMDNELSFNIDEPIFSTTPVYVGDSANIKSVIFNVNSSVHKKGFLPPRLTIDQRDKIETPSKGLIIYCLGVHQLQYYNGIEWIGFGNKKAKSSQNIKASLFYIGDNTDLSF